MATSQGTSSTPVTLAVGESQTITPLTPQMQKSLASALAGGAATASFFSSQSALQNFYMWLAEQDPPPWIQSTDSHGNPVWYVAETAGTQSIALITTVMPLGQGVPAGATFDVNSVSYTQVGSIDARLESDGNVLWHITTPVGAAAHLASVVLEEWAAEYAAGVLKSFCAGLWKSICNTPDVTDPEDDGDGMVEVAEEAAGEESVSFGSVILSTAAMLGIVTLFSIPVALELMAHESSQSVQIFNLTGLNVTWSLAYVDHGELSLQPLNPDGSNNTTIGPATGGVYGFAALGFSSASELAGIAYVLTFQFTDATGASAGQASVMFDIPLSGDNSLAITTQAVDAESWRSANEGSNNVTCLTVNGQSFSVTATFDYLSGEHSSPSGQDMYWYNSLIAFQPLT